MITEVQESDSLSLLEELKDSASHLPLERIDRTNSEGTSSISSDEEPFVKETQINQSIILNASFDPVFAINERGIINTVNDAAVQRFGYTKDELIGSNISIVCGGGHGANHDKYIRRYIETNETKVMGKKRELLARCKDGSEFPIELGIAEVFVGKKHKRYFIGFIRDLTEHKKVMEVEIERARSESLLENMLPERVAARLKCTLNTDPIADHYPLVVILFADLVGFTSLTSNMSAVEMVSMINELFCQFDALVDKYDVNKVKTIGDCYMVTSHPDIEDQRHECSVVCHFALDLLETLQQYNESHPNRNLQFRIGINVGPVVAGVVGTKRYLYDLWGDAVNVASRMESTSLPGMIQITQEVAEMISSEFTVEPRGSVQIKGKGEVHTFFLKGKTGGQSRLRPFYRRMSTNTLEALSSATLTQTLEHLKDTQNFLDSKINKIETQLFRQSISKGSDT